MSLTDCQREIPTHKRREGRIAQEGSGEGDGGGGDGRGERRKQNAGDALDPVVAHLVLVPPAEPSSRHAPGVAAAVDAVQREAEVGAKVRKLSRYHPTNNARLKIIVTNMQRTR